LKKNHCKIISLEEFKERLTRVNQINAEFEQLYDEQSEIKKRLEFLKTALRPKPRIFYGMQTKPITSSMRNNFRAERTELKHTIIE